jgi:hypothetical protein
LVQTNPFAGGGELEYPVLLHAAWATVWQATTVGMDWLHLLPLLTMGQILITVPLFFLLWDIAFPEPHERWRLWLGVPSRTAIIAVQGAVVLGVMALAWDGYIYPQSHFFLTAPFLLLVALLGRAWRERGLVEWTWLTPAAATALVLLLSNAVTGTAAVAAVLLFYLLRAADRSRLVWHRAVFLAGSAAWIAIFLAATPGNAAFGSPGFSYTAAGAIAVLTPALFALIAGVWISGERQPLTAALVMVLSFMGFFTFVFSARDIIVENAARFMYHAVVAGFPLVLEGTVRLFYYLRRELFATAQPFYRQLTGLAGVAALLLFLTLPALASVASAHDHLMYQDRQIVSAEHQDVLAWLAAHTAPDAVIIASPYEPWAVPQFTGRSLLRIDHWLSPQDELFHQVVSAWAGDEAAQEIILPKGDYLLLTSDEHTQWPSVSGEPLFESGGIGVYEI